MLIDEWPTCPGCDRPRSTKCPICGTAGSEFPVADMGFEWVPGADGPPSGASCGCGSGGCNAHGAEVDDEPPPADENDESQQPITLLMCPTCDEPFEPAFPRLCEWCGHEFPDGFEVPLPTKEPDQIPTRAIAVIVGLVLLAGLLIGYFIWIGRSF